jgi:hypothetical protein
MPRWYWAAVFGIVYVEMLVGTAIRWDIPSRPDPVFTPPGEYHWIKGEWDDDWDYCDPDYGICWSDWG